MGYVAVRGGGKAIEESLKLLEYQRVSASSAWGTDEIEGTFPELVDQVMGEASLYAPRLAALALKQAQGSPDEAVFLLRAFRSTLERPYVSRPVDTGAMRVNRRVSAAFKDVPGGQVLGATRDDRGECDPRVTLAVRDPQSPRKPHDQPAESKEARDAAAL